LASEHGNGHIELTRRANLQLRGVRPERVEPLREALIARGLVAPSAEAERALSWLCSDPLGELDADAERAPAAPKGRATAR
jgi:precorrin-3B synthase